MAELSKVDRERLTPILLSAYNARWSTGYRVEDYREPIDASADLHFVHPEFGDLKVQWTTPPMDEPEKLAVKRLHRFRDDVLSALTDAGLRGVILWLDIRAVPNDRPTRLRMLSAVVRLVQTVRDDHGGGYSRTDIPNWDLSRYGNELRAYFSEINVLANMNPSAAPSVWGGPEFASFVPDSASRAESALVHKSVRYGPSARDLVLVVHFDMDAYYEDEIEDVQRTLQQRPDEFKQVWILRDPAIGKPTAHCVKSLHSRVIETGAKP
jgi:hypothetical protein